MLTDLIHRLEELEQSQLGDTAFVEKVGPEQKAKYRQLEERLRAFFENGDWFNTISVPGVGVVGVFAPHHGGEANARAMLEGAKLTRETSARLKEVRSILTAVKDDACDLIAEINEAAPEGDGMLLEVRDACEAIMHKLESILMPNDGGVGGKP